MLIGLTVFAQQKVITGKVTDKDGVGIAGVSVIAKGSTAGTQTSADGSYSLSVAQNVTTLIISSVGYLRKEVAISGTTANVVMESTSQELNAVVMVGYGTSRKKDVTGAVTQVKASEFNQGNISSPLQQLQGKAAGVQITQAGGDPNGGISVRVRGLTSLSTAQGTGGPLFVIDGIVGADINAVGPNDIETVDILKDASSAAIYGARGANGVVLITTKKGRSGQTKVEYNAFVSTDHLSKKLPVLSGPEFKAAYLASGRPDSTLINKGANTDWQDEITQNALTHNHNIALSGGSGKSNYRASVTYINQEGIILRTSRKYLNGRLQMNQKAIKDKVNVALSLSYTNQKKNFIDYYSDATSQLSQENPFIYALNYSPLLPVRNPDGSFFNIPGFSYQNPVATLLQNTNQGDENLINASFKVDYELFKGFTLSTFGSILKFNNTYGKYSPTNSALGLASFGSNGMVSVLGRGNASRAENEGLDKMINILGNYKTIIGDNHNLDVTGGYEYYDNTRQGFGTSTSGFITDRFLFNNLGSANILTTSDISAFSNKNNYLLISFLGRVNYSYKSKYLLTLNGRYDGSSKLGKNNKWGFFPSVAAAWNIGSEDFMKGTGVFDNLKLRVGWGQTGNVEPIDPYNSLFLYKPTGSYYSNGVFNRGFSPSQINNEDLKWERREMTNIGLDFAVLKNRLSGTVEYYTSTTKDLLFEYGIPSPPLPFDKVKANAGSLSNKGFDITLTGQVIKGPSLNWNSTVIFSTVKNKIIDLAGSFTYGGQSYALNTPRVEWGVANGQGLNQIVSYLQPGQSFGSFFLRRFTGDSSGVPIFVPANPGSNDRTWIDPWNDFTFGWSNSVTYKAFDFNMQLRGQVGGKVFNGTFLNFSNINRFNNNGNVLKAALTSPIKTPPEISDYAVESSSFARLESASIGYTFKTNIAAIQKLRVYVAGNNLFIITNYRGYDPEVRNTGKQAFIDNLDYYPRTRSFSLGVNLTFE
jgi:iron complex outermembrane receptor protein